MRGIDADVTGYETYNGGEFDCIQHLSYSTQDLLDTLSIVTACLKAQRVMIPQWLAWNGSSPNAGIEMDEGSYALRGQTWRHKDT